MFARSLVLLFFVALAGRVLAQNATQKPFIVTVGKYNLTTSQLLNIPNNPPAMQTCQSNCSTVPTAISACNEDPACLCKNETVKALVQCEQCMFTYLVANNAPQTDFRIGSTPVIAGFGAACSSANFTVNLTKTDITLTLPANWDGPVGVFLPTPVTAIGVIVAFTLGVGAIVTLSNM